MRAHPLDRRPRLVGVVSPDHPSAARQRQRLDHAGKPDLADRGGHVSPRRQQHKAGLGYVRIGQRLAHRRLVARARDGGRRVVRQPQALGGERRGHHPLVIDADDRRERRVAGTGDDRLGGVLRVRQPQRQRAFAHRRRHRRPALGGDGDRHPHFAGRSHEVRRAIGGRRQDQEQTIHVAMVDRWANIAIVAITQTALDAFDRLSRRRGGTRRATALWVRVTGSADGEYTCALSLDPLSLRGQRMTSSSTRTTCSSW